MLRSRFLVPGHALTTLQVGGEVRNVIEATTEAELLDALTAHPEALVIGGGSNLVISDAGFDGTIIRAYRNDPCTVTFGADGRVTADASTSWDALVRVTVERELQGLESTSGVPGTVGGALVQNAGAYGQEISDVVHSVRAWDREARTAVTFSREECGFAYRVSRFKHDDTRRFVVTAVEMQLEPTGTALPRYGEVADMVRERFGHDGPYPLAAIRHAVLDVRNRKGMVIGTSLPSAGSFFTNPRLSAEEAQRLTDAGFDVLTRSDETRTVSAAALMEAAGFHRGDRYGRAGFSDQHVLALVNAGDASTSEVIDLARRVQAGVRKLTGITLHPEPVLLGFPTPPL